MAAPNLSIGVIIGIIVLFFIAAYMFRNIFSDE